VDIRIYLYIYNVIYRYDAGHTHELGTYSNTGDSRLPIIRITRMDDGKFLHEYKNDFMTSV